MPKHCSTGSRFGKKSCRFVFSVWEKGFRGLGDLVVVKNEREGARRFLVGSNLSLGFFLADCGISSLSAGDVSALDDVTGR